MLEAYTSESGIEKKGPEFLTSKLLRESKKGNIGRRLRRGKAWLFVIVETKKGYSIAVLAIPTRRHQTDRKSVV